MLNRPPLSLGFFYKIYKIVLSTSGPRLLKPSCGSLHSPVLKGDSEVAYYRWRQSHEYPISGWK